MLFVEGKHRVAGINVDAAPVRPADALVIRVVVHMYCVTPSDKHLDQRLRIIGKSWSEQVFVGDLAFQCILQLALLHGVHISHVDSPFYPAH